MYHKKTFKFGAKMNTENYIVFNVGNYNLNYGHSYDK